MVRIFWGGIALLAAVTAAVFFIPEKTPDAPEQTRGAVNIPASAVRADEGSHTQVGSEAHLETSPAEEPTDTRQAGEAAYSPLGLNNLADAADASGNHPIIEPSVDMPNPDELVSNTLKSSGFVNDAGAGVPLTSATAPEIEPTEIDTDSAAQSGQVETIELQIPKPSLADGAAVDDSEPAVEEIVRDDVENDAGTEESLEPETPSEAAGILEIESPATQQPDEIESIKTDEPKPTAAVVQTPDGLLLDGRWEVKGKGTDASPYEINWDMLVALQREYAPNLGKTQLPAWMKELDGKIVTIRGYALLPLGMSSMSELLVMLNQWDSCCIGIPPTPYDAIEVRLAKTLTVSARSMFSQSGDLSYGDITGTFKIDPYIIQGYLLGLYLMEDASANLLGPAGTP